MILEAAVLWALEGFARGLGNRLANAPGQKVHLKTLQLSVSDIRQEQERIRASQQEMQEAIALAYREFRELVAENQAFRLHREQVVFKPTQDLPTLGSALFELDAQIAALRQRNTPVESPTDTRQVPTNSSGPALFAGLDDEIEELRRGDAR